MLVWTDGILNLGYCNSHKNSKQPRSSRELHQTDGVDERWVCHCNDDYLEKEGE